MKEFDYVIRDEVGIHARPAGMLAKKAKEFRSEITLEKSGRSAAASKLMAVMALGVKCGDRVTVRVSGEDEETAYAEMEKFFRDNL
ncbi:MAG: HPr family phosphocarrier protein [Oscillospiraceae bacterium]